METILHWDVMVFEWINQDLQNVLLDWLMPILRSKYTWIPFYVGLIVFAFLKYKIKGLYFILALVLTVGLADTMSSKVVKKNVQRLRPCKDPQLKDKVHLLINCGSGYSFTSSHATNHFAVAAFLFLTLCRRIKYLKLPLILWASSIAFAQVYVGVHYPLDVLGGALLGGAIGLGLSKFYAWMKAIRIENFYEIA